MQSVSAWICGALASIGGLLGLLLAAHAGDGMMYAVGLLLFVFAVLFDFWLIKRGFDQPA